MIAAVIGSAIRNLPVLLFVLAVALALLCRRDRPLSRQLLSWLLLLPIGVTGLWAGIFFTPPCRDLIRISPISNTPRGSRTG